jgi:VWFA-related protein
MKRFIIGAVITVAMVFSCVRRNEAQSSSPSSEQATPAPAAIPAGKVFIMQLDTPLHTRFTKKGDAVEFRTAADVVVDDQILIPNQSLIRAKVKKSLRSGVLGGRAEIQLTLVDVRLPDGTVLPFQATITRAGLEPVNTRKGEDPKFKGEAGAGGVVKAGATAGAQGALTGVLFGGPKGALYGAAVGAATSAISAMFRRGPDLDLPANTMFEARFEKPLKIPAQSVIEQNSPAARLAAQNATAALNTRVDDPIAANRPSIKHPQNEQQTEASSFSKPESDAGLLPGDMSIAEAMAKRKPTLKSPENDQTIETTSVSRPESDTGLLPGDMSIAEAMAKKPPILMRPESTQTAEVTVPKPEQGRGNPPVMPGQIPTLAEPVGEVLNITFQVKMVQVDAVVRDRSGRAMPNLRSEDFKVYEDSVLQELTGFSQDKLPLAVAIVADRSGSMAPYITELRWIASRALQNLKPQDEICLFSFAQDVQLMEALTTDRQRIAYAINRIGGGGGTDIIGALHATTNYLVNAAPDRRHAIILISDNEQTIRATVSEQDIIRIAQEKDVSIYSLKTGGSTAILGRNQLPSLLFGDWATKITHESGGELIKVTSVDSLDGALNTVITRLRTSYSLGYYPSNSQTGAFHTITVRLADKYGKSGSDYSIQSKKGYYAVQSPSKSAAGAKP